MTVVAEVAPPLVVGHEWAVELLTNSLTKGHLSQAYLFAGPPRVGKTTLALYLARALQCLDEQARPCGQCSACRRIERGTHPDVRLVEEPQGSIGINQIRALQREMALSPFEGRWRVYVLSDFQQATIEAANCLLKTLEEPPPKVVLVLTATQVELLLPTIVSRCQVLNLRALPVAIVAHALQASWGVEPTQAQLLATLSQGRIGWAIAAARDDGLLQNREKSLVALEQALHQSRTERVSLAQQLCQNPETLSDLLDAWRGWWRDVMLAKSGNGLAVVNVDRRQTVLNEAQHLATDQILGSLRATEECAEQVEQNVNPCLALEVLLLRLPRRDSET
jgi:DNA polymerase-3 subunit delta'